MTYFNLIIASFLAALASEGQPTVSKMTCQPTTTTVEQVESLDSKQKMRETGMLQMDRYERFLDEPMMTFSPQRHA